MQRKPCRIKVPMLHIPCLGHRKNQQAATTPTIFTMRIDVGGIKTVVHLTMHSSLNSSSSAALAVTVKFVSNPASIFRKPSNTANKWAETHPITQNCLLRHQSSMLMLFHLNSRTLVIMMEQKSPRNRKLARFDSYLMIN